MAPKIGSMSGGTWRVLLPWSLKLAFLRGLQRLSVVQFRSGLERKLYLTIVRVPAPMRATPILSALPMPFPAEFL